MAMMFAGNLTTGRRECFGVLTVDPPDAWYVRAGWRIRDGVVWLIMFALLLGAFALNPEAVSRGFLTGFVVGTVAGR